MAPANKPADKFAGIDDNAQYKVTLTKAVQLGRSWLRPGDPEIVLKGKVVKELADGIADFQQVAD